ncbi:AAA family ATPase [Cohnella lupini]|uniref:Flp pilus assembly CpaE family ATPase n=1 Tax=Cohnella lupini TaxID=1294267 RepID=A0A3D9HZ16_9BACL|nr:AAA family ATPase [Cohnella lupini]RED54752.1 Flp pilus assembly CpaE family ATPase [Cohnella lupini]
MAKRVVIAVSQREYAAKLAEYLREEEPDWEIAAYTHDSALRMELQDNRKIDLLIGEPNLLQQQIDLNGRVATIIALVEERGLIEDVKHWQEVVRYQPLPAILSGLRVAMTPVTVSSSSGKGQIVTVFSASGGLGKTTVAINLIRQAGERGLRTFYLNMEALNATSLLFGRGEPDSLSRLLYAMQAHPDQWKTLLGQLCRHQPQLRTDYLDAPDHPGERLALTSEVLEALLERIRETERYDLIVIDPDSGAGEWHRRLLQMSDKVVWVTADDAQTLSKTGKLLHYWKETTGNAMNQVSFVLNKGNGGAMMNQWNLPSGAPAATLPYIPQWKAIEHPGKLLNAPAFSGAVEQLFHSLGFGELIPRARRRREDGHGAQRTHVRGAG